MLHNVRNLIVTPHLFYFIFFFKRGGFVRNLYNVQQLFVPFTFNILATFPFLMCVHSLFHIVRDATIQTFVTTLKKVDVPVHCRLASITCFSSSSLLPSCTMSNAFCTLDLLE